MTVPPHIAQRKRWYKTRRWQRLRARVLAGNPMCAICHRAPATQCDHVEHLPDNSTFWTWTNLRPACAFCNNSLAHRGKRPAVGGGWVQTQSAGVQTDAGATERRISAQNRVNELFHRLKEDRNGTPND